MVTHNVSLMSYNAVNASAAIKSWEAAEQRSSSKSRVSSYQRREQNISNTMYNYLVELGNSKTNYGLPTTLKSSQTTPLLLLLLLHG
jgi:hypothetical protein